MVAKRFRCAVIGCGWIGAKVSADLCVDGVQSHAGAYERCDNTELVGLCDVNSNALTSACDRWPSARGYEELLDMLECERPEIVSICTPDDMHYSVCKKVLSTPGVKAIIVEKPLASSVAEARALLAEADSKNIEVVVNYSRRFAESHQRIKKQILEGEVGELIAVNGAYSKGILHNGSHWFDLVRWLIGEIVEVEAWDSCAPPAQDPTCHVRVRFNTGVQGFLVGIDANQFSIFELDIIGTLGRLRIRDSGHQVEFCQVQESAYYTGYLALGMPKFNQAGFKDGALRLIENTVQILSGEGVSLCSGSDGLIALTISEMACCSLAEKKRLNIDYQ